MMPTIGVSHCQPKLAKTASKACITPAVRDSSSAGTIQLIASAGQDEDREHQAHGQEHRLAGTPCPGSSARTTWTAFISMPE